MEASIPLADYVRYHQFASGMDEGTLKTPTNPLMSSLLVIFVWGGEAIL
jgi:hypothetical protein